jgi:hypothetical protein
MDTQRMNDTKNRIWGDGSKRMSISSIELDPRRITLLELFRLFRKEQI